MFRQVVVGAVFLILSMTLCLAVFAQDDVSGQLLDYRIMPGDILSISIWGEEDLQNEVLVRPDGGISFPLAGEIRAAGQTVDDLRGSIKARISQFIPNAVVSVSVLQIFGNKIYVIGQVKNPGAIVMNPRLDVMQALSIAGGATPFAKLNDIIILRRVSGGQKALQFRYSEVIEGNRLEQNIMLEPGDVVIVP